MEGLERERRWRAERIEGAERELEARRDELEELERSAEAHDALGELLREHRERMRAAEDALIERNAEAASVAAGGEQEVSAGARALALQLGVVARELAPLLEQIARLEGGTAPELERGADALAAVEEALGGSRERMEHLARELVWRREQMDEAARAAERGPVRALLGRTGLGRIVRGWGAGGEEER
jgi:chromosome segregation ATPase